LSPPDAILIHPRPVAALQIRDAPIGAVKINQAMLSGEKRITNGDVTFRRTADEQAPIQPSAGNLVTVNAEDQTCHDAIVTPFRGKKKHDIPERPGSSLPGGSLPKSSIGQIRIARAVFCNLICLHVNDAERLVARPGRA
jgi:hypothetical protein